MTTKQEQWAEEADYILNTFLNEALEAVVRYMKGKDYGRDPQEYINDQLGHWPDNFKAFVVAQRDQARREVVEEILTKMPKHFWEDGDHAVGGYVSRASLKKLLDSLANPTKGITMQEALDQAEHKAKTMTPDNSAPLMTHDIEKEGCNGLEDCPVCANPTTSHEIN